MMTTQRLLSLIAILSVLGWASACGDDDGADSPDSGTPDSGVDGGDLADSNVPGNNPVESDLPSDDLSKGAPPASGSCPQQGLDELCRRRDLAPVKPADRVIDADGWSQPETVLFHDTVTGAEIFRITDDPSGNIQHCHINRSTFNADGSYVSFGSRRCWEGYYCPDNFRYLTTLNGRGPHIIEVPSEHMLWVGAYEAWDPSDPNVLFFVNHEDRNGLYRVAINDGAFVTERLLELPNPTRRKHIFANVGPDGTLAIKDTNVTGEPVHVYVWHPETPTEVTTFDLNLGLTHPDHDPASENQVHDFTLRRNPDNSIVFNYGPQSSSGEPLFVELSSDGSSDYRISYATNEDTHCPVPYYSHPAWSSSGTRVVFNGTAEKTPDGTNPDGSPRYVWNDSQWGGYVHEVSPFNAGDDYATSTLVAKVAELDLRIVHYAWDGYDDRWIHGAGSQDADARGALHRMRADGTLTELLAYSHSRTHCGANCDYCSLPRPAQSPDGTKVLYTSDMLHASENTEDLYVVVHRYPFAPVWLGLDTPEELRLTWRLHNLAREIRGVRVLRSADVSPPVFEPLSGVVQVGSFLDDTITLQAGETILYAVTAVEHSGLESRSVSRIIRVTRESSSYRVDQVTPYGTADFDTTAPAAPSTFAAAAQSGNSVRLTWTPGAEADLRLFHIYASPDAPPELTQAYRIASMPAVHPSFLDWSVTTGASTHYAVTAVDFQGNESEPARTSIDL